MRNANAIFFRCEHSYVRNNPLCLEILLFRTITYLDSEILFQSEFGQKARVCSEYLISERQPFIDPCISVNSVVEFPGAGSSRLRTINSELNGAT